MNIIHIATEETLAQGLLAIKLQISAWMSRVGARLGAAVAKPAEVEPFLAENLAAINAQLLAKGSTAALNYEQIPSKIAALTAVWQGTQTQYDALQNADNNTLYIILEPAQQEQPEGGGNSA